MRYYFFIGLFGLSGILGAQDFSRYQWTIYDTTNTELATNLITDVILTSANSGYVTTGGLEMYHFDHGAFRPVPGPDFEVRGWLMGMEWWDEAGGKILICGMDDKLVLFDPATETYEEILFVGQVTNMERNHLGNFLYGMHPGNYFPLHQRFRDGWQGLGRGRQDVMGIYIANNGDAYVGYRDGLYLYPMQSDGSYRDPGEKLSDLAFYELDHDSRGVLWGASFSELKLHRYRDGIWETYANGPEALNYRYRGSPEYIISNVMVLPDDRVVIGSQFTPGIAVFDGEHWQSFRPPSDAEVGGMSIRALGPDGSLWCTSGLLGLLVFRPVP